MIRGRAALKSESFRLNRHKVMGFTPKVELGFSLKCHLEEIECVFRPPYLIFTGDYRGAIYKFHGMKLDDLHTFPADEQYFASKCETDHNQVFFLAFHKFVEHIRKVTVERTKSLRGP